MPFDLHQNHFELFGLPARFSIDPAALEARLSRAAARGAPGPLCRRADAERRVSMQLATRVNEALSNPEIAAQAGRLYPAVARCGPEVRDEYRDRPPNSSWNRWAGASASKPARKSPDALLRLQAGLRDETRKIYEMLHGQLDEGRDDEAASQTARKLMFYEKLAEEIDDKLAELET